MSIVLMGSTSGSATLQEQAVAGSSVLTLPVGTGTLVANNVNSAIVSGTSVASTSGTSIDFTGIPSWVKRITIIFNQVSVSGTSSTLIQLGTGSTTYTTTGYSGGGAILSGSGIGGATFTTGFCFNNATPSALLSGNITITNITGNTWVASGNLGGTSIIFIMLTGGSNCRCKHKWYKH